jgi:hypothetical protein
MEQPDFRSRIKLYVDLLVAGDYQGVIEQSFHQERQQAAWIAEAISLYPGQLTTPPISAYEALDVYEYDDGSGYNLEFFLWVDQEPSDLIILVDAKWGDNELHYTFWDIYAT